MTTVVRFTCTCGLAEEPLAQNCTIALLNGRPHLVVLCATNGRPVWTVLTDENFAILLFTPILLDPDVRDMIREKAKR